mgnify:FL=1
MVNPHNISHILHNARNVFFIFKAYLTIGTGIEK